MRNSVQRALEQLDKVMFKNTDTAITLTIIFTLCVITVGTEIRLECLTRLKESTPLIIENYCQSVQTYWHDTLVAIFAACKDLEVRGDIRESIFELTTWRRDYSKSDC